MSSDLAAPLPCHACGYDVRAQPMDGVCPECGAGVPESRRLSLIPRRPAWRDSDPRWRRRMLAGAWLLTLVPLFAMLMKLGWAQEIPTPRFYAVQGRPTLGFSFVTIVYSYLVFCMGIVLLFAKERGRRNVRLDRLRPWGVVASYGVLGLGFIGTMFTPALVVLGIAALLQSIAPAYQPATTGLFVELGTRYMFYMPHPSTQSDVALAACSSIVVLLACVPLWNALRSSGPRVLAVIVLAPLALWAVLHLVAAGVFAVHPDGLRARETLLYPHFYYFEPRLLVDGIESFYGSGIRWAVLSQGVIVEASKWLACLSIALWLTVAQLATIRRRGLPRVA